MTDNTHLNSHLNSHLLSLSLAKQRLRALESRNDTEHPLVQVWIGQERREIESIQALIDSMSESLPTMTDDELLKELTGE